MSTGEELQTGPAAGDAQANETVERICDLVEEVVALLVNAPDEIELEYETTGNNTRVTLAVDPADLGLVLGRQGRTVRALRTVVAAASARLGHNFVLDVAESV